MQAPRLDHFYTLLHWIHTPRLGWVNTKYIIPCAWSSFTATLFFYPPWLVNVFILFFNLFTWLVCILIEVYLYTQGNCCEVSKKKVYAKSSYSIHFFPLFAMHVFMRDLLKRLTSKYFDILTFLFLFLFAFNMTLI